MVHSLMIHYTGAVWDFLVRHWMLHCMIHFTAALLWMIHSIAALLWMIHSIAAVFWPIPSTGIPSTEIPSTEAWLILFMLILCTGGLPWIQIGACLRGLGHSVTLTS